MKRNVSMLAVGAALLFASVSAQAENHPVGVALKTAASSAASHKPSGYAGGASGLTFTGISVGGSQFYPCYNCAGSGSVAVPYELNTVKGGSGIISTLQMQDTFFSGYPTVNYSMMQKGKVISSSSVTFPFSLFPNEEALVYFPDTAPTTVGAAQVVMQVMDGSTVVGSMTYNIFID